MSEMHVEAHVDREAGDSTRDALDALLDDAERRLVQGAPVAPDLPEAEGQLSIAQRYLWSHNVLEPENPSPNRSTAFRFLGDLDVNQLSEVLASQLQRHPELRSSFPLVDGEPRRTDSGLSHVDFEVLDLRALSGADGNDELGRLMRDFVRVPFDLASGPVIRAQVLRVVDHEFILHLVIHHIVMDAWSAASLRQDLNDAYFGSKGDAESAFEPQPASYSEYVAAQQLTLQNGKVRTLISFDTVRPPRLFDANGQAVSDFTLREAQRAVEWSTGSPIRLLARRLKRFVRRTHQMMERGLKLTRIRNLMYQVIGTYLSVPHDGPIDVLQSMRSPESAKLQANWNFASTGDVRFWPITGSHSSMWEDDHVENTASVLMDVLTYRRGDETR